MSAAAQVSTDPGALNHIITSAEELTTRIADWRSKGWHVLSPAHQMTAFPPSYGVIATAMFIDTREGAKECYSDGVLVKNSDRALSRVGIQKIEQLAGVNWLPNISRRTDDRRIQNVWEYESWLAVIGYDGQPRTVKGTAEVDLRDGSAQIGEWSRAAWAEAIAEALAKREDVNKVKINGWSEKRVLQARQFGLRLAETKSQSAAVRAALGLKPSYTLEELKHPFVVLKVTYIPDYNDVSVKHLIADRATQGVATLYANAGAGLHPTTRLELPPPSPTGLEDIETLAMPERELEPVPVRAAGDIAAHPPRAFADSAPAATPTPAPAQAPPPQTPPPASASPPPAALPDGAVFVESVDPRTLNKRAGGTYTKAYVVLSDGRQLVTVYPKYIEQLKEARDNRTPLFVGDKRSDFQPRDGSSPEREITRVEAISAPQDRALPLAQSAVKL